MNEMFFGPRQATLRRVTQQRLLSEFAQWGYDEISTSLLQQLDPAQLTDRQWERACKWFGHAGRIHALRTDMTLSILQALIKQPADNFPERVCYVGSVVRQASAADSAPSEILQAGVELMGYGGVWADAEVLALAARSLESLGVSGLRIGIGQASFQRGLFSELQLPASAATVLQQALAARDLVSYRDIASSFDGSTRQALGTLPDLLGGPEVLQHASKLAQGLEVTNALQNLQDVYKLLSSYHLEHLVYFDLGMVRDFSYYSGSIFEAFLPGLGRPVLTGGRYDELLEVIGVNTPATGFAINLDLVVSSLGSPEQRNIASYSLLASSSHELQCFKLADTLRQKGLLAAVDYRPISIENKALSAQSRGFIPVLVDEAGCWQLSKEGEKLCKLVID